MHTKKLIEAEWNFQEISDSELIPACYYEFSRESKSIREFAADPDTFESNLEKHADHALTVILLMPIVGYDLSRPWTKLRKSTKKSILDTCEGECKLFGGGGSEESNRGGVNPVKAHLFPPFQRVNISPDDMRNGKADIGVNDLGIERLVVEIDWKLFKNEELLAAFKDWLKHERPDSVPMLDRRGKEPEDWKARLWRLGLLRLRAAYPVEEALKILQTRFKQRTSKFVEPSECNREAKKALKDFRSLFPFLPASELPLSWPMK